jgi:hypothetical protein
MVVSKTVRTSLFFLDNSGLVAAATAGTVLWIQKGNRLFWQTWQTTTD